MRTGAIFARGSCRALKWMALVGMMFFLGGGEGLAQPTTTVTHTAANGYSDQIIVLTFNQPVWGNVPDSAFGHSAVSVTDVIGLPTASPGTRQFSLRVSAPLVAGSLGTVSYTQPTEAARRLKMPDSGDAGTDPDDVAAFATETVTE